MIQSLQVVERSLLVFVHDRKIGVFVEQNGDELALVLQDCHVQAALLKLRALQEDKALEKGTTYRIFQTYVYAFLNQNIESGLALIVLIR